MIQSRTTAGAFAVIIDDDPDDIKLLEDALDDSCDEIKYIHFDDPVTALSILVSWDFVPNYIFLDMNMPGLNGLECLVRLRGLSKYQDCRITILSTGMNDDLARKLHKAGADYAHPKPSSYCHYGIILNDIFVAA